jgi:hypothetical protein
MIEFYLTKEELQKALASLQAAEKRGFGFSEALFRVTCIKPDGEFSLKEITKFEDQIILKAHPTDASKNWGRIGINEISCQRFVDGVLVDTYEVSDV